MFLFVVSAPVVDYFFVLICTRLHSVERHSLHVGMNRENPYPMDPTTLLHIPEEDFTGMLIRYGLYFGAFFQIICLAGAIFLPASAGCSAEAGSGGNGGSVWGSMKVNMSYGFVNLCN